MPLPEEEPALAVQVVDCLTRAADLLEALGENPHRIRAYRQGGDILSRHSGQLAARLEAGTLTELPGIGKELAAKVTEVAHHGTLASLASLEQRVPAGIDTLMQVPGVGRKLAIYLKVRLHIHTVAQLRRLLDSHLLQTLPWLGADGEAQVRQGLLGLRDGAGNGLTAAPVHHES